MGRKGQAIQGLLRYRLTGTGNGGNAGRAARRAGLQDLSTISNRSLAEMARESKKKCKSMLAESPWLRRQFLAAQLQAAVEDDGIKKASDVKAIMRAERQRKGWNAIKNGLGQKRTPAPTMAETVDSDGKRVQCTTKESVETAIHGEISPKLAGQGVPQSATDCCSNSWVTTPTRRRERRSWKGHLSRHQGQTQQRS